MFAAAIVRPNNLCLTVRWPMVSHSRCRRRSRLGCVVAPCIARTPYMQYPEFRVHVWRQVSLKLGSDIIRYNACVR